MRDSKPLRVASCLLAVVLLPACASAPKVDSGYESAVWLWKDVNGDPRYRSYVNAYQQSGDLLKRAESSGCAAQPSDGALTLFLIVDAKGVVTEVHTDKESAAAKCYREAYVGMNVPVPPFSPLPLIVQLQMPAA